MSPQAVNNLVNSAPHSEAFHSLLLDPNIKYIENFGNVAMQIISAKLYAYYKDTNLSFGFCAITTLGNYNPKKDGHLVLWDLGLVIKFPPGFSRLFQWVECGFQIQGDFPRWGGSI
ncbi:hypothetical protein OBBRIDRAFT_806683 [Obba rivulosa]|uniref:Uncharacterized protein n=1 Tax=Obba rivulosa TaxID=1052685 RepID=A0A8E2AL31_9APHY|nr:hypothetical protein OBBRIDRAFT_806683 [Obba rivulosa]